MRYSTMVPDKLNINGLNAYSDEVLKYWDKKIKEVLNRRKELREYLKQKEGLYENEKTD